MTGTIKAIIAVAVSNVFMVVVGLYFFRNVNHFPWETAYPAWTWIQAGIAPLVLDILLALMARIHFFD